MLSPMAEDQQWFGVYVPVLLAYKAIITREQWLVASIFILFVGLAMAELASSQPTSGGVRNSFDIDP
jgi:amino acid transporter